MSQSQHARFDPNYVPPLPPIREAPSDPAVHGTGQQSFCFPLCENSDDSSDDASNPVNPVACPPPCIELSSNFCSGNLRRAECEDDNADEPTFSVWTALDCEGTSAEFETTYRTWFNFSVRGATKGQTLTFIVRNMNKQTGLFMHDHRPSVCRMPLRKASNTSNNNNNPTTIKINDAVSTLTTRTESDDKKKHAPFSPSPSPSPSSTAAVATTTTTTTTASAATPGPYPTWARLPTTVTSFKMVDGSMELKFKYAVQKSNEDIRFAFCFPLSYWETQRRLEYLDYWFSPRASLCDAASDVGGAAKPAEAAMSPRSGKGTAFEPSPDIYYHRELLSRTLDGRRMDLITITSMRGLQPLARESSVPGLFPEHAEGNAEAASGCGGPGRRAHAFGGRPIVYISSRVHPGETPASFVFEGALRMLLARGKDDPRAAALRRHFVFKLVPILNPDGVSRGHYRADTRGVNLNRRYASPDPVTEPTVFASKTMVVHYHASGRLKLYLDLHAHASKRGCFIYGNHCETLSDQVENMLWARLISLNSPYFDFDACNFSEQNMKTKDKRDKGQSKEGSGRVAVYLATGKTFAHSYTLECNYNTGRTLSAVPGASHDKGRASPPSKASASSPKYNPATWMNVGRACMASTLDLIGENPWSRVVRSRYHTLDAARMVLYNRLRHSTTYRESAKTYKKELAARTAANARRGGGAGGGGGGGSGSNNGRRAPSGPRKAKRVSVTAPSGHARRPVDRNNSSGGGSSSSSNISQRASREASKRVAAANARSAAANNTQWRVIESPRMPPVADMTRVNIGGGDGGGGGGGSGGDRQQAPLFNTRLGQKNKMFESKFPKGPKLTTAGSSVGNFAGPRAGPRTRRVNASSASAGGIVAPAKTAAVPPARLGRQVW